jgi:hypothetical protein
VTDRPGLAILRSAAPRFQLAVRELSEGGAPFDADQHTSIVAEVTRSARVVSSIQSRSPRFQGPVTENGGPGMYGVPPLPNERHSRASHFGTTPRFGRTFRRKGDVVGSGSREANILDLETRGPKASLAAAVAVNPRTYSALRSSTQRFQEPKRPETAVPLNRPATDRRTKATTLYDQHPDETDPLGTTITPEMEAAESFVAREARLSARSYRSVFGSKQPRLSTPAGDIYLRQRLASMDSASRGFDRHSLAAQIALSPRRGASLASTSPRFTQERSSIKSDGPGPGSYDTAKGLDAVRERQRSVAIPTTGRESRMGVIVSGDASKRLVPRFDYKRELRRWTKGAHGVKVSKLSREEAAKRWNEGGCGADVVYDVGRAKQFWSISTRAGVSAADGGAVTAALLKSTSPRFADPISVRAGRPRMVVTEGARIPEPTFDLVPEVDNSGRVWSIDGASRRARSTGPSAVLASTRVRFPDPVVEEGAAYSGNGGPGTIAWEMSHSMRGRAALRHRGREEPVFRKDAMALGWTSTGTQDSSNVGGLARLVNRHTKRPLG